MLVIGGDVLTGHDPQTGKELWRWGTWNPNQIEHWRLVPSPVAGDGVFLACAPKGDPIYAVKAGGSGVLDKSALAWVSRQARDISADVPTPAYYDGDFFILSDVRRCLSRVEPKTGKVKWTVPTPGREKYEASPLAADGKIYLINFVGQVSVFNAADGKVIHSTSMDDPANGEVVRSSIVAAHGQLFIRTTRKLYCVGKASRKVICLDGIWQLAEGSMAVIPREFGHAIAVPGLADMATPALKEVGVKNKDSRREAFWYRRTFTVDGPIPAVALLKIHKACYGTRVYLNGQCLGDHLACFTPGYFDCAKHLKGNGQHNELIVRVGASHTAVPATIPWGHDFEKIRYIPGIYDSVELILSGTPQVVRVQAVPDLPAKRVRVAAVLRNSGPVADAGIRCTVREARSHKPVGTALSPKGTLSPGQETTVEVSVPIENCRPWSPEDPFLYELETTTGADTLTTRFGMRSFQFDPKTKQPLLNGKPYYLRGTNICIYRFFEDPLRGDKPWREEWVRAVIRAFRSMHWNACRYCIGFPPELWYRVADEEGLMIQDEFPVWGQTGALEVLTQQYTEWMQERWNHPSVIIWDAQNETPNQQITGKALSAVRHLDLSGRPWDNGWDSPQNPTDVYEAHPYRHIDGSFRMAQFARMSPRPGDPGSGAGNPVANKDHNPIIINEYGWLWLNRDGTRTTLTANSYRYLVGPKPTPAQLRYAYARTLAAKTEFWRCGRQVAGVLHFCGLGYSRPGGQTSDNFIDIDKPTFEPNFFQFVRDAFAPVGLMVDFWADEGPMGVSQKIRVVAINDLDTAWNGPVTLRLVRLDQPEKIVAEKTQDCRLPPLGREVLTFALPALEATGPYRLAAELRGADGLPVRSLRDFAVLTAAQREARRGIAVGRPVTTSSDLTIDGQTYPGRQAVDDDLTSRWSSEFSDPQWLVIDLGAVTHISRVELSWEAAYGKSYAIQVSTDGKTWTEVYKTDKGKGGTEELRFSPTDARWVRYYGIKRATPYGHSLWEFRVFRHTP